MTLALGDVQTCEECGASSEPIHDRGGRPFAEGGALVSTWANGPFPRHLVAGEAQPIRCPWCNDLALGFPALTNRPNKGEVWEVGGPLKRYLVPPWVPAARAPVPAPQGALELAAPPPAPKCLGCNDTGIPVGVEHAPLPPGHVTACMCAAGAALPAPKVWDQDVDQERAELAKASPGEAAAGASSAARAIFEKLSAEFRAETGMDPPGQEGPGQIGERFQERQAAWIEWLQKKRRAEQAATTAPAKPKPPRGQLSLFGGGTP